MSDAPKKASGSSTTAKDKPKRKFPLVAVLVPVALIAAAVLLFTLPPTHAMLVNGPLKKFFSHGPAQTAKTEDPSAQIAQLNDQLASAKATAAQKDQQIAKLQSQLAARQAAPAADAGAAAPTPAPSPTATVVPDDIKRVAMYWAQMDAEKAAALVAKLPVPYVKLVFAQMPADSVADIIDAVPPKLAAVLSSDEP